MEGINSSIEKLNTSTENDLTDTEKVVMSVIQSDDALTITEIAKKSNLSRSGAQYIMDKIKRKGKIKRIGSKKSGKWSVMK